MATAGEIQRQDLTRDQRLEKLGGARDRAGRAVFGLVKAEVDTAGKLTFGLDRTRVRTMRGREGRYVLRTVAFVAYCLSITLRQRLKALAGGLMMPRVVFEKLAMVQLLDVRVPTTDGGNCCWCAAPNRTGMWHCCWRG